MPEPTKEQMDELAFVKRWRPFDIVYGALSPSGEWRCGAVSTMRVPNALARIGWKVWIAKQ